VASFALIKHSQELQMPATMLELEAQVLNLAPADRAHLLERLIDSFEPENKVRDAWLAEAERRHEEIKSGKVSSVPGAEALARIRARIA
jgi:putative addiction module component (TIGR02574 family)